MKKRPLCMVFAGLMIVLWILKGAGAPVFGEPAFPEELQSFLRNGLVLRITGTVSDRQIRDNNVQYILNNSEFAFRNNDFHLSKLIVTAEAAPGQEPEKIPIGSEVLVYGTLKKIAPAGNPGQFDRSEYYACEGIWYSMWGESVRILKEGGGFKEILRSFREKAAGLYRSSMGGEQAGVLSAMLLGDKTMLQDETRIRYQFGGINHILAISGMHIMLLGLGLYRLLKRLYLSDIPAAGIAAAGMGVYCFFAGAPASAMRACIMFSIVLLSRLLRRTYDLLSALSLAGILILLAHPGYLFASGFQLSFGAVAGIALFYPCLKELADSLKNAGRTKERRAGDKNRNAKTAAGKQRTAFAPGQRAGNKVELEQVRKTVSALPGKAAQAALAWLAVSLMLTPVLLVYYSELPLFAVFVNLLIVPGLSVVLGAGLAGTAGGLLLPFAGKWALLPADLLLRGISLVTDLAARLPHSSLILGEPGAVQIILYYLCLGAFWIICLHRIRKKKERKKHRFPETKKRARVQVWETALILCAFFILLFRNAPDFRETFLDVGQGDCTVLQCGRNTVFVVDGGSTSADRAGQYRILPFLKQQGIAGIEGVFITHPDLDHYSGLEELLRMIARNQTSLRIRHVLMPDWMKEDGTGKELAALAEEAGAEVLFLHAGNSIRAGDLSIAVLHPFAEGGCREGNAGSLVLEADYRGLKTLLTGDLEKEGEEELLPYLEDIDILKVAHHGSRNATSAELLLRARPEVCTVSAPANGLYGHPHAETLERIRDAGADCYITKECGAITVTARDNDYTIRTFLNEP